jgi:DNA-binding XRE family transcriptional regulator
MAKRTKEQTEKLKELAERIYLSDYSLTQKDVSEKVGVTEKTISAWIEAGKWKDKRNSLLVTKKNQLVNLYQQLEQINEEIKTRKIVYDVPTWLLKPVKMKDAEGAEYLHTYEYKETDYPVKIGNTPTSKEADIISKISSSINKMETETSLGEIIECGIAFLAFIKPHDLDFAKKFSSFYDSFIQSKL